MKSFAGDAGDDLGIDSSPWPAFADAKEMTCPGHRLQNGLGIEWLDCSQINDLDIDSFFSSSLAAAKASYRTAE